MKTYKHDRRNSVRVEEDRKIRYKMYKDGKKWAFAGLATSFFILLPFMQSNQVQAATDTTDPTGEHTAGDSTSESTSAKLVTPVITDASAKTVTAGTATITGQTTAGATVIATATDGTTAKAVAASDGTFSISLAAKETVSLTAEIQGTTSSAVQVTVPAAQAAATTDSSAANSTKKESADDSATTNEASNLQRTRLCLTRRMQARQLRIHQQLRLRLWLQLR